MNKILSIIAEYNPFHNGHLYHLQKSLKETNCSYTIAIIGGNFTQRGSTSLINKWEKAELALQNGIDLVIELPLLYSISSAENFAEGCIKILNSLQIVDYLSFGSESGNLSDLTMISDILLEEPEPYKNTLSKYLNKGLSFPNARENALLDYLNNSQKSAILSSPNNILGIEYLKALKKYKSSIIPFTVKRYNSQYHDITQNENIASATAIRNYIERTNLDRLKSSVPSNTFSMLLKKINSGHIITNLSIFEKQIIYNIRKMSIEEISNLPDVGEGLEYAIKNTANSCNNLSDFFSIIKSKRYTHTRLQRILLYSLLGISKKDIDLSKNEIPYIRILGFNSNGKYLISKIAKTNPKLEIITSVKKYLDNCTNQLSKYILEKDIWATNVYTLGYKQKSLANLDYTHNLIKL